MGNLSQISTSRTHHKKETKEHAGERRPAIPGHQHPTGLCDGRTGGHKLPAPFVCLEMFDTSKQPEASAGEHFKNMKNSKTVLWARFTIYYNNADWQLVSFEKIKANKELVPSSAVLILSLTKYRRTSFMKFARHMKRPFRISWLASTGDPLRMKRRRRT